MELASDEDQPKTQIAGLCCLKRNFFYEKLILLKKQKKN